MIDDKTRQEAERFFEWDGERTDIVTFKSCLLFAEHMMRLASKPLTDEQISDIWEAHIVPVFGKNGINPIVFARAIERGHGIK
jgi:hypothetical protein